jgi:hypothetical protein
VGCSPRCRPTRRAVLEPAPARCGVPRPRPLAGAGQGACSGRQRHAIALAAGPSAGPAAGRRRLHGTAAQRRAGDPARRQAAAGALWPGLRPRRAAGPAFRWRSHHLHAARRGRARRPHPQPRRQGQRLHPGDEGLGLRRRQRPASADDDLRRALERGLRRPAVGRGALQQPQARRGRRCAGELPAQAAARGAGRHALELQHRRDQPGGHPGRAGNGQAAGELSLGEDLGNRPAWSSRPPGS